MYSSLIDTFILNISSENFEIVEWQKSLTGNWNSVSGALPGSHLMLTWNGIIKYFKLSKPKFLREKFYPTQMFLGHFCS